MLPRWPASNSISPRRVAPSGTRLGIRRRGAGLVELMVATVLGCIIASVAIPQYLEMRRKALRAEPAAVLRTIGVAQQAWFVAQGSWVAAGPNPVPPVDGWPRDFDRAREDWRPLGWYPEGQVRCSYSSTLLDQGRHVRADALCDLDHDGQVLMLRYQVPAAGEPGNFVDVYPERY